MNRDFDRSRSNAGTPKALLHIEGGLVLLGACLLFHRLGASWVEFGLLFLAPDIFMLGYIGGKKSGALCYNTAHTYLTPALVAGVSFLLGAAWIMPIALIWTAHIGFDRLLGYGLKYPTGFKETHLQRV